jgi:PAS domain S-box-containing protein
VSPAAGATVGLRPPSGVALRTVLDLASQLLCVCDTDGQLVWCNLGFERALGHEPVAVIGRQLGELADEDGGRALGDALSGSGEVPGVVARMRHRDGTWRTIEWNVRAEKGRGLVFAAGRDVTSRLAAEQAVAAGEARLRAIVAHSPSAIFVQDPEGRYLLANRAWAELAGCAPDEMIGRTDAECGAGHGANLTSLRGQLQGSPSSTVDLRLETPSGPHDLMMSLFSLGEGGGPHPICAIATDITERKRAESALLERERLLDTVLDASPDIISLIDAEGRVRHVSSAEQTLLGHRHDEVVDEVIDADLYSLVHPEDFDQVASAFITMVTGSRSQLHVRYRVRHAEDRWVTVDSRAQAVTGDDGRFLGAVVVTRDISSRLESEQRLQALRQAAEQASRAKSDFLSRMSHELRTPLNAILGFSQLLEMDKLPVQQGEAVDHILRAGGHLRDLIDEVLDIARIESGHLDLAVSPVLVADVVSEVLELSRPMAERDEVVVQSAVIAESGAVLADRGRLVQVVLNLVSNAIKYNHPGGRVDISCEVTPGARIRLAVADTGQGIRPEDLDRVFEPFERLGAGQTGVEGTGVGLSLVRHLVDRMRGTLEVESVPDVGSTFFVELPMALLRDEERAGAGAPRRADGRSSPRTFGVLLVEEDLSSFELVERVLARRPGVTVLGATDGGSALELARQHRPDLVLLDLQLPDQAASELLERLGEGPAMADIRVAVLSSDDGGGQVRRMLGRGVAGQLSKPIDARALLSLVDAVRAATGK